MKSDTITARGDKRRKHARALLDEHENDWDGSSTLDELAGSKYAVVWQRDSDAWVLRAATAQDLAAHYLDAANGTDGIEAEWIESVVDLDTGEDVGLRHRVTVEITLPDGEQATASYPDGDAS